MKKKVYLLVDNCIWDYENSNKVVGVATSLEVVKAAFKDYVKGVKEEISFYDMDAKEYDSNDDNEIKSKWIYTESDRHFSLYENGYSSRNNIEIGIEEFPLLRECDYGNKDTKFTVIENKSKVIYEDKDLALRCYLDLCEIGNYPTRNRFFDTYLKIKNCKGNIISDNSKIEECYEYTYKDYEEENNFDEKIDDEKTL